MTADRIFCRLLALVTVAALLFAIPLAITLFPGELQGILHGAGEFGLACASAVYALGVNLPPLGLIVLGLSLLAGSAGVLKIARTLARTRRVLERKRPCPLPARLERAARRLGVAAAVVCVDERRAYAYTAGLLRPRIWVSLGLARRLRERELTAVLAHEATHLRRLDPLRLLLARALRAAILGVPLIGELGSRFEVAIELDADRVAMRTCGRGVVASALWKLSRAPSPFTPAKVAIGAWSLSHARIEQLCGASPEAVLTPTSGRSLALSLASFVLMLALALGQAARANLLPASALGWLVPSADRQVHVCPMPAEGVLL